MISERQAHYWGVKAAQAGLSALENPYSNAILRQAWNSGYTFAKTSVSAGKSDVSGGSDGNSRSDSIQSQAVPLGQFTEHLPGRSHESGTRTPQRNADDGTAC